MGSWTCKILLSQCGFHLPFQSRKYCLVAGGIVMPGGTLLAAEPQQSERQSQHSIDTLKHSPAN